MANTIDKNRAHWPESTYNCSPYKPALILSILDLIETDNITENKIYLTKDLSECFLAYCNTILPLDKNKRIGLPFFHMQSDSFWEIIYKKEYKSQGSLVKLYESIDYGRFEDDVFMLISIPDSRERLRSALINKFFIPEAGVLLGKQSLINRGSFAAGEYIFKFSQSGVAEHEAVPYNTDPTIDKKIRDAGFRRAVLKSYDQKCAVCGIKIQTIDGHTVIEAAHIVPWSRTHDDRVQNGLSLCRLCHWNFDEGMMTVSKNYTIRLSKQLTGYNNIPAHLSTLESRSIFLPAENVMYPDEKSLKYHQKEIFRK
jgi:putative restriction endonuclease